jgi:hypothetical protein
MDPRQARAVGSSRLTADLKLDGAGRNIPHYRARVSMQAHSLTRRQLYLLDFDVLNHFAGGESGRQQGLPLNYSWCRHRRNYRDSKGVQYGTPANGPGERAKWQSIPPFHDPRDQPFWSTCESYGAVSRGHAIR